MSVEIQMGTPLAEALNTAIQGKISELGWGGGGAEDSAMSEYFVLMLANGKSQSEIAAEISGDLLGLGPEDQTAPAFATWLFDQLNVLNSQLGGGAAPTQASASQPSGQDESMGFEMETDNSSEPNVPTGPKAMRDGSGRGGREKRMLGNINRAMDRTHDPLHRVQNHSGVSRISRNPPSGPRGGGGRQPRNNNGRTANLAAGLMNMGAFGGQALNPPMNGMNGMGPMNGPMNGGFMMGNGQTELLAMMEQQGRMIQEMQQQLMTQQTSGGQRGGFNGRGRSLFERTSRGHGNRRGGAGHQFNGKSDKTDTDGQTEDVEMGQGKTEPPNPEETICKFNLRCTNKDCKFAHQSPAAPPGVTIDVKDVCTFGAACKNRKCVGRHPSPATKTAHQGEQDCKFFPNCTNPHCPFRHPAMPPCRNGGECKVPNCKFTHVKTMCKFNPCTNRFCPFTHEDGQRGTFQDKVWTADQGKKKHVSDRKFVDENAQEDLILPETDMDAEQAHDIIA
ncbi:hypothetical protein GQ53DRAFT_522698 [Thozetella sp. PMI_491]|nr:hypothetical protein GQ53DRAFT_522698 [Thozetella sp. PMI_491]